MKQENSKIGHLFHSSQKNNGHENSVYDQEMRGPIFNDHQKIKKIIFKKMEEDNKKGKRVSILLLNSQYKRVQKSLGQFS